MLVTSAVAVKRTLTMSSSTSSLRAMISRISSWERSVTWATVSSSTVVAPRRPLTMRAGAMAAHSTGIARQPAEGPLRPGGRPAGAGRGRGGQGADLVGRQVAPLPGRQRVSRTGPIRVRTRRRTGWPTASHMRRTWRLRPSWITMRSTPGRQHAHLGRRGRPVVELHALAQRAQGARAGRAAGHLGHVLLGHAVGGMGEQLGQRAVVGQDQEPLGVAVEPPDREDTRARRAPAS